MMASGFSFLRQFGGNRGFNCAVLSGAVLLAFCVPALTAADGFTLVTNIQPGKAVEKKDSAKSETGFATSHSRSGDRVQRYPITAALPSLFKKSETEKSDPEEAEPKIIKRPSMAEPVPQQSAAGEIAAKLLSNEELLQKGDAAFAKGDKVSAEPFYCELISRSSAEEGIDEQLAPIYHRLGIIERDRQEYAKAQEYFVLAIKSDPAKNPQITLDYAKTLYETGKYERAKNLFSYLEEKYPEISEARQYKGLCLLNLNPEDNDAFLALEETLGREEACRKVREKCLELGKTEKAEEMAAILETLHQQSESANEAAQQEEKTGELLALSSGSSAESTDLPVLLETEGEITSALLSASKDSEQNESEEDISLIELGSQGTEVEAKEHVLNIAANGSDSASASQQEEVKELPLDQVTHINSPLINLETLGPKRIIVGQESEYKIVVENKSSEAAHNLIVRTEIPDNVEITCVNASAGASHIGGDSEADDVIVCFWDLGEYDSGRKETLVFKFVSHARNDINFVTTYDVDRTILNSGIVVTEPALNLTLEGKDEIEWGTTERYSLNIRNVGDGEAQNIRLTVSTGDNDNATRILKCLGPGEEKQLDLNMKTVLDGVLKIEAAAEADYGVRAAVEKSVDILRGNLDLFVDVPEVQFVNENAEYEVHICNTGRAPLADVEVTAAVPTSIEVISVTGDPIRNNSVNQMVWFIPMIQPEEEVVYQVSAKLLRAGMSRIDVTAADKTGVSCFGNGAIQVESIAALEMKIKKPAGAVATGKEIEYEIVINNTGTKAAEMIDAGFFLPAGMTPLSVAGGGKVIPEESKVLFNKINFLGPGQSVVYTVRAVAEERGNHKVQAVLESKGDNIQLVSEEMNFFYDRKPSLAQRNGDEGQLVTVQRPVEGETPAKVAARSDEKKSGNSAPSSRQLPGPRTVR